MMGFICETIAFRREKKNNKFSNSYKLIFYEDVEMESAALYINAARAGKRAVALLTISASEYEDRELNEIKIYTFQDESMA